MKPGYKQTEVGVIPEDWEVKSLAELAELTSSKRIFETDYVSFGIPFYRGTEISTIAEGQTFECRFFISEAKYRDIEARFGAPQKGDILITAVGTLGNVLVVTSDAPFYFKDGNLIWFRRVVGSEPAFLGLQLRFYRQRVLDSAIGSSQKALTIVSLKSLSFAIPPRPEQRAIAEALSDVDGLLGGLDRLIAKKRDLKQAAMQQLLTAQTRLPGFHGAWTTGRLGDAVSKIVGGGTPSRGNPAYWGDEIPWATVKDFATFDPYRTQEYITSTGLKNSSSSLVPAGTIITSTRMALGKAVVYRVPVAINQDLKALFLNADVVREFLLFWFEMNSRTIDDLGSGSTVKGISLHQLRAIPLHLPTAAEQTAIAEVLSEMDAELEALERRREKTRALKQAMMQQLLTGQTRLV